MQTSYYLKRFVDFLSMLVAALLGLRFVFRLFGANADSGFVDWVYTSSGEMISPFRNIFANPALGDGSVLDFTALFAMLVYGLIALFAVYLIDVFESPRKRR